MFCSKLSVCGARGLATSSHLRAVNKITVIGAGEMGRGISQVSSNANIAVTLVDQSDAILAESLDSMASYALHIGKLLFHDDDKAQLGFVDQTMSNIKTSTDVASSVKDADLVIEAVDEDINIKWEVFAEVEKNTKSSTLLCTNTSSLGLASIGAALSDRTRFGGLHFFPPVPLIKLVEVVRHDETTEASFNQMIDFAKKIGKVTVVCKDTPGFIVNRLLVPYFLETLLDYERRDPSCKDIDMAMRLYVGYPLVTFDLADHVGLCTFKHIMDELHAAYPDANVFKPSALLTKLIEEKKFGTSTSAGFYRYNVRKRDFYI